MRRIKKNTLTFIIYLQGKIFQALNIDDYLSFIKWCERLNIHL